jgi:hypothetical protein
VTEDATPRYARSAVVAAYLFGALLVLGVGLFLLAIPIQVSDSFGNMLKLSLPWREMAVNEFTQPSYLRPFLWFELKAIHDLSGGQYYAWFRGTHVLQVLLLVVLYLHLIRPRTWLDAALVPLGLAVLVGHHTFAGTVNEAFPINTFLTVLLYCFAAAALSLGEYRRWHDPVVVLLLAVSALTVESGLLVWVIVVGGALVGARGISRAGLAALTVTLLGYFALRFLVLDTGAPSLSERASGYGFSVLEPHELAARFGNAPLPFYLYNVATSFMSVLFGEPRAGVFRLTDGVRLGGPYPAVLVAAAASTSATVLVAVYALQRRAAWLRRTFTRDDRLVLVFLMVLAANAVISYPYTKDVIMSPAGAFFALAVFAAARGVMSSLSLPGRLRPALAIAYCAILGIAWSLRVLSVPVELWVAARNVRNDWAYVHDWVEQQRIDVSAGSAQELLETLRTDALLIRPPAPELEWARRSLLY